jgi:hypothetical protein
MRYFKISLLLLVVLSLSVQGRTWTSTTGKTVEGDFVKLSKSTVHVLNSSGKLWKIPLEKLSDRDLEYAKNQGRKQKNKKESGEQEQEASFFDVASGLTGVTKQDLIFTGLFHLVVIFLLFKFIFGSMESFWEACKYGLKPDWISWWQGDGWADFWNEAKLKIFLFLIIVLYVAELAVYRIHVKEMFIIT